MQLSYSSYNGYDVIALQGDLRISFLPVLTPQLSTHIQTNPHQNIVLDLSEVTSIDSSAVRLFVNLHKRLDTAKKTLYLLRPSSDVASVLSDVNLSKVIPIIDDSSELQQKMDALIYEMYLPFSHIENGFRRLHCSCAVCGSRHIAGYLIDTNAYTWHWEPDDYFPVCQTSDGTVFDYFAALPIVCLDCFMTGIDPSYFNILDKDSIVIKANLDENTKMFLSKSIKKRKKMIETDPVLLDTLFQIPRNRESSYQIYLLAESCARTMSVNKTNVDPFLIGFINFLALKYAESSQRDELVNNCRTWLTQAMTANKQSSNHTHLSQACYILLISALTLGKTKEASKIFQEYATIMEKPGLKDRNADVLNSPNFWFRKADHVWKKEIEAKSSILRSIAG